MGDLNSLALKLCNHTRSIPGWAEIPNDLLFLLLEHVLGLSTYIRFGAVCQSWHSLVSTNHCSYKPMPWLMLSESLDSDIRQFYDLSTNEIYELPLPQAQGRKILGCNHGWLVTIGQDGELHLLNPLTAIQIALPSMYTFQSLNDSIDEREKEYLRRKARDLFARKATLSCDPSTNDDVVVMLVNLGYDSTCLSYCRLSSRQWRNFRRVRQAHISYAANKFYSITWSGLVSTCEINPKPKMTKVSELPASLSSPKCCYTVECGGELLFILCWKNIKWMSKIQPFHICTTLYKVYKLNLQDGSWVETDNIGDFTIFVGNNNAICLPAAPNNKAYKKNSIYFSSDDQDQWVSKLAEGGGYDMGVFSLDNKRIDQLHYLSTSNVEYSLPTWVVPNLLEPGKPWKRKGERKARGRKRRCMETHQPLNNRFYHQSGNN